MQIEREIKMEKLKYYFYNDYKEENHSNEFNKMVESSKNITDLIRNAENHTTKEREELFFGEIMKCLLNDDELMIEYVIKVDELMIEYVLKVS